MAVLAVVEVSAIRAFPWRIVEGAVIACISRKRALLLLTGFDDLEKALPVRFAEAVLIPRQSLDRPLPRSSLRKQPIALF